MRLGKKISIFLCCFLLLMVYATFSQPIKPVQSVVKTIKLLPILLDFKDEPHQRMPAEIADMFFGTTPQTKTLPNYYKELGTDALHFVPGSYGVGNWIMLPKSKREYAMVDSVIPIANDALTILSEQGVNLDEYDFDKDGYLDFVIFVQAGDPMGYDFPWWPHSYTMQGYVGIGTKKVSKYNMTSEVFNYDRTAPLQVICHEFYHYLGGWDLYSYLYTNHYAVGPWDIMAENFNNFGLCGFSRAFMGWIQPTLITKPGVYEIDALAGEGEKRLYRVNISGTQEYFLIENRQYVGVDAWWGGVPSNGLIFTHVDGGINPAHRFNDGPKAPGDDTHFAVWVEDAGGVKEKKDAAYSADRNRTKFTLETNPNTWDYAKKSKVAISFTEISKSANKMTFRVDFQYQEPFPSADVTEIDFGKIQKGIYKTKPLHVINVGQGLLSATLTTREQWIRFDPDEFVGNDVVVQVTANADYSKVGKYRGKIDIKSKTGTCSITIKAEIVEKLGDVNDDGLIDESDIEDMLSCFGTKKGDRLYNIQCDLDSNHQINLSDLSILCKNMK